MACRLLHFVSLLWLLLLPGVNVSAQSVAPQLTAVSIASSRGNGLYATTGDTVTLTFTSDQPLQTPDVSILGKPANIGGSGLQWMATIPVTEDDASGPVGFVISYSNLEGEPGSAVSATTNGSHVTIDRNFPEITSGPENVTASAGGSFLLSIEVSSSSPFTCQWRRNLVPIELSTETTLTRTNVQTTDTGYYDVVVTNLVGEAIGGPVLVQVFGGAPAIVSQPAPRLVAAGGSATFSVSATGAHALSYQWRKAGKAIPGATHPTFTIASAQKADAAAYSVVVSNSLGSVTSDAVVLTVVAANITGLPLIDPQPVSVLAAAGDDTGFYAPANGAPTLVFEWRKNGTKIKEAPNSNSYGFTASLANAGIYSVLVKNGAGSVVSAGARLAVVDVSEPPVSLVAQGDSVTLKAVTAGSGLLFQWQKDGVDLADANVSATRSIKGTRTATLLIKGATAADRGGYGCVVRLGNRTLQTSERRVRVYTAAPQIQIAADTTLPGGRVGVLYTGEPVPVLSGEANLPTNYSAAPLPPGLKIDPVSGIISGRPTKASAPGKPFAFTIKVTNKFGSSNVKVKMEILPLPSLLVGTFTGIVGRDPAGNSLGGRLTVTTNSSGTCSGSLVLGARPHSFTGVVLDLDGDNLSSVNEIPVKTAAGKLVLILHGNTGEMNASFYSNTTGNYASIPGWRNETSIDPLLVGKWRVSATIAEGQTPDPLSDPAYPQGDGWLTLNLSAQGALTWAGKMADGTAFTAGGSLCLGGRAPLQVMQYGNSGSTQGWCRIVDEEPTLNGTFSWYKADQGMKSTSRSYKRGIPIHHLAVTGYRASVLEAPVAGLPPGRKFVFREGGLPTVRSQMFKITPSFGIVFPPLSGANHHAVKFTTFDARTGVIKGTFYYETRLASFEGLLFTSDRGFGHFLLPEAPDEAGETLSKTPIRSGRFRIELDLVSFY